MWKSSLHFNGPPVLQKSVSLPDLSVVIKVLPLSVLREKTDPEESNSLRRLLSHCPKKGGMSVATDTSRTLVARTGQFLSETNMHITLILCHILPTFSRE